MNIEKIRFSENQLISEISLRRDIGELNIVVNP